MDAQGHILVIVHPGSACGSANFNLGKSEAQAARDTLRSAIEDWEGGVIIIDGDLSDELDFFPSIQKALALSLERAAKAGLTSRRVTGNDPEQSDRIREFVEQGGPASKAIEYHVSGAWYHPEDGSGCVGSVIDELKSLGCHAEVHESAVWLEAADENDDDDCDDRERD
jgi:hypothetical protein